jgi:hypothetical protein
MPTRAGIASPFCPFLALTAIVRRKLSPDYWLLSREYGKESTENRTWGDLCRHVTAADRLQDLQPSLLLAHRNLRVRDLRVEHQDIVALLDDPLLDCRELELKMLCRCPNDELK